MILIFRTNRGTTSGACKGLKIDTTAKTFACGYFVLRITELLDAVKINARDYRNLIEQCKNENYKELY